MAKAGRRYPLVIYRFMLDRWWPAVLALGLALFGLAWVIYQWGFESWRWFTLAGVGGFVLLVSLFLFVIRYIAYVQPRSDHLRLVTPFLRINISYKRIRKTSSASMSALFPPKSVANWQYEMIEPLLSMPALVIELNGYPIRQHVLRFFLSRFFFKDKTPHFVILVRDWMRFSSELETMRAGGGELPPQQRRRDRSILARLPPK